VGIGILEDDARELRALMDLAQHHRVAVAQQDNRRQSLVEPQSEVPGKVDRAGPQAAGFGDMRSWGVEGCPGSSRWSWISCGTDSCTPCDARMMTSDPSSAIPDAAVFSPRKTKAWLRSMATITRTPPASRRRGYRL